MKSGVYVIRNTINGKVYVGSTKSFHARFRAHKYALQGGKHHSRKLQRAWVKYGSEAFSFEKVLVCAEECLLQYEQIVIDYYQAHTKGYNHLVKAGSRAGTPHDKDTVSRMRAFQRSYRKKYQWQGRQLCIAEIAEEVGLPRDTLWRRVVSDRIPLEEAVSIPYKKPGQPIEGFGTALTFYEWVERIGCTQSFLRLWLQNGLTIEECVDKRKKITVGEFGRVSGISSNTFSARIRKGWSVGDALAKPIKQGFTPNDAKAIRELAKTQSTKSIAERFGVHKDTITLIVRNISFSESQI